MEEIKKISNMGYDIGKKAKLHEIELLSLLEMIKYDQYHDFLKRIFEIARKVKVSIPDELYKYDHDTFENKFLVWTLKDYSGDLKDNITFDVINSETKSDKTSL